MSDAKIADTSTDVQKQIDAKYSLILEKLKVYDDYAAILSRLDKSDDLIFSIIKSLDEKTQADRKKLSDAIEAQASIIIDEKRKSADVSARMDILKINHDSVAFDLDVVKDRHARLHSENQKLIGDISAKSVSKEVYEDSVKKSKEQIESVSSKFKELDQLISDSRLSAEKQSMYMLRLQSDVEDLIAGHLKVKDQSAQKFSQISQRLEDHISSQVGYSDQISSDLIAAIKELKRLNEAAISSIQIIESDLKSRIESLALDATNAISRSMNVEMHAKILDKKVDAINLQLRKNELS